MIADKVIFNMHHHHESIDTLRQDVIEIDWFDCDKKILRKTTNTGQTVGLRLEGSHRIHDGDVVYRDDEQLIIIRVKPVEAIVFQSEDPFKRIAFAYVVGNRHMPLFLEKGNLAIKFDEPLYRILTSKGFDVQKEEMKLMHPLEGHSSHEH